MCPARFALPLLVATLGCGASRPRSPRVLDGAGTLVVTNSPMVRKPADPTVANGDLSVPFAFIVENIGQEPADLYLSSAEAMLEKIAGKVACRAGGHPVEAIRFATHERWRIDCRATFAGAAAWLASAGDLESRLTLPIPTGNRTYPLVIPYYLRAEDGR